MNTVQKFYSTLFGPGEATCFSDTPYGTEVLPIEGTVPCYQFFSINPMKESRKDTNVTCFRNILLEFDKLSLEKQEMLISEIPHTTVVYSGSKSYHCIISLEVPCHTKEIYSALVHRIMAKVPQADKSTKNPSRFSRCPEVIRRDTGHPQVIKHIGSRVSQAALEAWLGPEAEPVKKTYTPPKDMTRLLKGRTAWFLLQGAPEGSWNMELFCAALDMLRCGIDEQQAKERLETVTGRLDKSDLRTIQSAIDTFRRDG